ncbi:serine hydrolase domain-containing protein [Flagellimonas nanhaiensis]|nr:serine hydrolase domain-containing protein [Allomuricauda nanhaiensis]
MKLFKFNDLKLISGFVLVFTFTFLACQTDKEVQTNKYDTFLSQVYGRGQFNGNALILKDGKIVFQGAYGIGNIAPIDSLKLNSVFRIGSVSKQFTAMGIMILKDKGKLSYDQDIRDFIPELPYEGITIRHLLNHVSGLPDYTGMMNKNWKTELKNNDPQKLVSGNDDLIRMFAQEKPEVYFKPGEKWEYSNTGYVLLATIVSRSSGVSFGQFLKEHIFKPAGMEDTSVYKYIPGSDPQMPMRVYGFRTELNGVDRVSTDYHYLNGVAGDGGIYSTLADLLKWDRILYTERLVSKNTLKEAFDSTVLNNGEIENYGFGWRITQSPNGKKAVYHSGGWVGFSSYIYREIEEDNCIIFLANNSTKYLWGVTDPLINMLHDLPVEMPKLSIREVIGKTIFNTGIEAAIKQYKELKDNEPESYDFKEKQLNFLGYQLLQMDLINEAVEIFRINKDEYPQSANTYDSYGDALLAKGDEVNALINFKKAYELDPTLKETKEKINSIETSITNKKEK